MIAVKVIRVNKVFNYSIIIEAIDSMYKKVYMHINAYLEYIVNAPSTINRIAKYYAIGFNLNKKNEIYIMFDGQVIKTYIMKVPKVNYKGVSPCSLQ